ncbi:glycosyltransferase family 9 protein [Pelotalea chapellei]|uniref:Glycosyltransferase family 9 protein n=1 Tax=Pelotalea chapellei TaxID=44671 RepID=A0ABS5U7Y0_9BACT|nr:glycosyltransferase family 9 protein [Pelotalea chapellei]MBT1071749.1 glycosyltransferase family 9 protein [Pelotalea chapellei]
MRIRLLKSLDAVAGRLAALLLRTPPAVPAPAAPRSILLIRPGGIGDAVYLIPAINALSAAYPNATVDVLAERRNAAAFDLAPGVRRVFLYDRPAGLAEVLRTPYDVVIDTEQWHRLSAVVARLCRAPFKIGFATNQRSRMFTHCCRYSHDTHETASFMALLEPLGIRGASVEAPFLAVPPAAATEADRLLSRLRGRLLVVLSPGASIAERRWGQERFRRVAELLKERGVALVVVGGVGDREQGDYIVAGGLGLNLAGSTSLSVTAGILQRCSLLLSGDSGVLHIGVGLGVPTVSLFGPGRMHKWAPRGAGHIVIDKGLACSPCTTYGTTPACPEEARCMKEIGVDEVFDAVSMLLAASPANSSATQDRVDVG